MKREVPIKNYIIYIIICLFTVTTVLILANWYQTTRSYSKNTSIITSILPTINVSEISNYAIDNPEFVIYIAPINGINNKTFEKKFKKLIINNEIKNIVYLDSSVLEENLYSQKTLESKLSDELKKKNTKINFTSNMLYIKNNKITKVMYEKKKEINIEDVKNFLISCEVF